MKVICISGKAGHGKDTAASLLKTALEDDGKTVLITHYADLLKYICAAYFGWDGQKDEKGRGILQYVGTDVVRRKAPDFWVRFISNFLTLFDGEWDYVLIPDCRFPNEIDRLKADGFDVTSVRIRRPHYDNGLTEEQLGHPSETSLDDYTFDYVILNDGSIPELHTKLQLILHQE